ncbi:branched-chain amino acid ABC transporter permease [Dactylosporangium sp. NBC_01737]|uniref:ABC transporter permease subunit n=1 Tax=Dactylosporangium sp. NBC_01737 TaxID=2975959 RepID=UPI002E1377DD|nr:branched-chain amino acid ABC transporter permease [Dactylosporangium sp. NBC_01737]
MTEYLINTVDGVAFGLLLFTAAAGLTLAFGVADMLNLAHGTFYAIGAYTAAAFTTTATSTTLGGFATALAVAVLIGAAAGAGLGVAQLPLAGRGHLAQVMLTLGVAYIGAELLVAVFGADDLPAAPPTVLAGSIRLGSVAYPTYRLVFIAAGLALAGGLHLVVYRTRAGAVVRACVDDRAILATLGIRPATVQIGVLAAAGALAATGGVLGAPIIGPGTATAPTIMLLSLVVVVLGGLGNIRGTFLAALTVGQIQTLGVAVAPAAAPFALMTALAVILTVAAHPRLRRRFTLRRSA